MLPFLLKAIFSHWSDRALDYNRSCLPLLCNQIRLVIAFSAGAHQHNYNHHGLSSPTRTPKNGKNHIPHLTAPFHGCSLTVECFSLIICVRMPTRSDGSLNRSMALSIFIIITTMKQTEDLDLSQWSGEYAI